MHKSHKEKALYIVTVHFSLKQLLHCQTWTRQIITLLVTYNHTHNNHITSSITGWRIKRP